MHAQETIENAVYVYDANTDDYKPTILPLSDLPDLFYAETMRHLAFQVNSDIKAPFPINSMHSGILSGEIHTSLSLQPVDRIFDEAVEALERNTELQPMSPFGWYQLARTHVDRREPEEARRIIRHLHGFEPGIRATLERDTRLDP